MLRYLKLQKITIPKCCQQRRSGRVKRRMHYADFLWASLNSEMRQQGGSYSCASCKDGRSSSTATNMDLIKGTPVSGHVKRRPDEFQDQISISKDGENKAYVLKRLERPFTELESLSQSTVSDMDLIKVTPVSGNVRRSPDEFQDQNSILKDGESKTYVLKRLEAPFTEVESLSQSTVSDSTENRDGGAMECEVFDQYHRSEMVRSGTGSGTSGTGSGIVDSCSFKGRKHDAGCFTPGKLVWAKTAYRSWWPAQITEEILVSENCGINHKVDGGVLVCFYGSHDYAWVDPLVDLADFDESFEENSCDPRKDFQQALDEALIRKRSMNHNELSHRRVQDSITPSQLNQSDDMSAWKLSSSNIAKDDETEQRRGKRKRKPKVHFDEEVSISLKSLRRVRRLRIMRHLGLAAPPGSPFSVNSPVRTAA